MPTSTFAARTSGKSGTMPPSATLGRFGKTVAMDPNRLTKFLDSANIVGVPGGSLMGGDYGGHVPGSTQSLLMMDRPPNVYDPSLSWDGLSVDPRPFSRFDARPTRVAPGSTVPVGLAGTRVVELDYLNDGTAFGKPTPADKSRPIPPTFEELDTRVRAAPGYDAVVLEDPSFRNFHLKTPATAPAKTPDALVRGGAQLDRCLLNPHERREIMEFEHKVAAAKKVIMKADAAKNRLKHLMKTKYPSGVIGVDNVRNLSSEVYGELGSAMLHKAELKQHREENRRSRLGYVNDAKARLGYNPFHHSEQVLQSDERRASDKIVFQTKNRDSAVFCDTHSRLFVDNGVQINEHRTQKLRDETLGGKQFNIVTNTLIETLPSRVPFRNDKKQAHPSNCVSGIY